MAEAAANLDADCECAGGGVPTKLLAAGESGLDDGRRACDFVLEDGDEGSLPLKLKTAARRAGESPEICGAGGICWRRASADWLCATAFWLNR